MFNSGCDKVLIRCQNGFIGFQKCFNKFVYRVLIGPYCVYLSFNTDSIRNYRVWLSLNKVSRRLF